MLNKLIDETEKVIKKGWIKNQYNGYGVGGITFEKEIGVTTNNFEIPDYDGIEIKKNRSKFRCPLADRKNGCTCPNPCSDSKYGRTVHLQNKDNPRLINIPPRDSDEWKKEYNNRTSSERCNKREKIDYKYEDGSHRSSKHWYCRLYCIMMCQHLDAWDLPFESELSTKLKQAA